MKKEIITILTLSLLAACGSGSSKKENDIPKAPITPIEPTEPVAPTEPVEPTEPVAPTDKVENKQPTAKAVSIRFNNNQTLYTGDTLEGYYEYIDNENDPEGNTQFRWLVDGEVKDTSETYTIKKEDADKKITLEVTPVATSGTTQGDATLSNEITAKLRQFIPFTANITGGERVTLATDGTPDGTFTLKNFSDNRDAIVSTIKYNKKWLMSVNTKDHGYTLAATDGTEAGTDLVNTIYQNMHPANFTKFQGRVFFTGTTPIEGRELWVTEGTAETTRLVKDLEPGNIAQGQPFNGSPNHLSVVNNKLIFTAYSRIYGTELWVSDGTHAGTYMFKDLNPGFYGSNIKDFYVFNDKVFFTESGQLYTTDGTTNGTSQFSLSNGPSDVTGYIELENYLVIRGRSNGHHSSALWLSDGTTQGTTYINTLTDNNRINEMQVLDDTLYYTAGGELFSYNVEDGAKKFTSEFTHSSLTIVNNTLYFQGTSKEGSALFTLKDDHITTVYSPDNLNPELQFSFSDLTALNDSLLFIANDSIHGREIWVSDGTQEGTKILVDLMPGEQSSYPALCHLQSPSNCER